MFKYLCLLFLLKYIIISIRHHFILFISSHFFLKSCTLRPSDLDYRYRLVTLNNGQPSHNPRPYTTGPGARRHRLLKILGIIHFYFLILGCARVHPIHPIDPPMFVTNNKLILVFDLN